MTISSPLSGSSSFKNIPAILERGALLHPRRKAVIFEGRSITYAALNRSADSMARRLARKHGVARGDRVAVLLHNSPEFITSFFGAMKTGAVVVPLNYFLTPSEIRYIAGDCEVKVLITSGEFRGLVSQIFEKLPALGDVIYVDEEREDEAAPAGPDGGAFRGAGPGDMAAIIYTSGTTGHPKGAMLTHCNLIGNLVSSAAAVEVVKRDRFLLVLPVFHAFTITACILMPLFAGARIVMLRSVRPFDAVMKALLSQKITVFIGIPGIFNIFAGLKFSWWIRFFMRIRVCISGSAPLPCSTLERWQSRFAFPLLEGYGLSEASPVVSINPYRGRRKTGSVGVPIPGVKVRILSERGGDGDEGEILVKGPNIMKGYYNRPEDTKKAFHEGWLRTGDMGRIDDDGYIFIVGRKSELLLVHGMNVYPREIEEVLYCHPKVCEAAVVGRNVDRLGEMPVAFLSLVEGENATYREMKEHCSRQLARYKVPRRFVFLDSLPRTSTGKILKRDLQEMARNI